MDFKEIRQDIELVFEQYRKHKYYTLFIDTVNISVTSKIDDIGGGHSNEISDNVAREAIRIADKKREAKEFVDNVESAVEQLPDIEKQVIKLRYMSNNHNYINDYTVYEIEMDPPVSAKTYRTIRERAFEKLHTMLVTKISLKFPS